MPDSRALSRWVTLAAAILAAGLVLLPPALGLVSSYERVVGSLDAEAELSSLSITQIISANPELWEFEHVRLSEFLSRRPRHGDPEIRRIVSLQGAVLAESADPLPTPWVKRSLPLLDAGLQVGSVEIIRSARPQLRNAGLLALALALPGLLVFYVLRTLPLDALRRAHGELARQRDTAQKYLDVAGVAFVILDRAGVVTQVNRKGSELLSRPPLEVVGREWAETFVEPQARGAAAAAMAAARPGEVLGIEFAILRPTGDRRIGSWYATPLLDDRGARSGLVLSGVDVTQQRQLEEQLRHAQKLRAVGQLAGGVAHDFNNILAAIRSRAAMLRADLALGSPHRLDAEEILAASDRAAALTRSLLTFSRRQALATERLDLCELVRRSERRLRRLLPAEVFLVAELPDEPLVVLADPIQIDQVLSNLVSNARDAIRGTGRIVISASRAVIDADGARRLGLSAPGEYAQVAVADNGVGLDLETQARLFEPFYTTKEVGKGTGLGLAIAFGIVELHRGTIHVASEEGRGTTVTFLLPAGAEPQAEPLHEEELRSDAVPIA
jgi:PAS domain S-box-containing protein